MVLGLFIGLAIALPFLPWPTRKSPNRVLRRLRGGMYETRVRAGGGIWNPAKPLGVDNPIFGPGDARYWTDESGLVHLDFCRANGRQRSIQDRFPKLSLARQEGAFGFVGSLAASSSGIWRFWRSGSWSATS